MLCNHSGMGGLVLTDYTDVGPVVVILCPNCDAVIVAEDQTFPPLNSILTMPDHEYVPVGEEEEKEEYDG